MLYTTFGRTGLKVSRLAFGAGPIGYLDSSQDRAGQVLNLLLDRGVNVIDTAAAYLGSEELDPQGGGPPPRGVCAALQMRPEGGGDHRRGLVGPGGGRDRGPLPAPPGHRLPGRDAAALVQARGAAAGGGPGRPGAGREAGKIRFAGYSGDNEAAAFAAGLPDVDVLMCSVSICDQVNLEAALPAAARSGPGVIAKRTVANAAWKPLEAQQGVYRDYVKPYADRFREMALDPRDLGFSGPEAWMEIALRFTLAEPGVHVVSVGTTSPANAEANLRLLEAGPLDPATVARIRKAFRTARERSGDAWPGLT